jgi:hypothetical protein
MGKCLDTTRRRLWIRKETLDKKGEKYREFEGSDLWVELQITSCKERKRKERDPQYYPTYEGSTYYIETCIEPTTPCASLRIRQEPKPSKEQ